MFWVLDFDWCLDRRLLAGFVWWDGWFLGVFWLFGYCLRLIWCGVFWGCIVGLLWVARVQVLVVLDLGIRPPGFVEHLADFVGSDFGFDC